ncbi:MAG: Fe-S cluster assembly protein SufD [Gammaproteobacteria bacterium]
MMDSRDEKTMLRQLVREQSRPDADSDHNPWMSVMRKEAASWIADMPAPHRKMEAWRYTPLDFIDNTRFSTDVTGEPFTALEVSDIEELLLPGSEAAERIVFVNGRYAPALSTLRANAGIGLHTLAGPDKLPQEFKRRIGNTDNPRHLVVVDSKASIELVERYASLGKSSYFNNAVIDVLLSDDSRLVHTRLQEESEHAQHLSHLTIRLGAGSHYRQVGISSGAAWSRTDAKVVFAGEGAHAELDGLMLAGNRQFCDVHLEVLHEVPGCTSREHYKGLLNGNGRVVFDGRILVAKDAQKTSAALNNENLMLSRSAEVDTKPQLEILADDVKCSHGATVGELDQEMLFYLRSRGIPRQDAERMLCAGFADEVIGKIPDTPLRERVRRHFLQRLAPEPESA